jgi:light-regulated signal transduction histidine kinase (bacteriophytochrome)
VHEVLNNLSWRIGETGAKVLVDALPTVHGDPTLLPLLFQNLAVNALKFVRDKVPSLHFTYEFINAEHVMGVRDSGIGIDANFAQTIFSPFKRLHARSEYEGTGIGLSICKTVVERHGGRIWVDSEPGRGAHFRFTLAQVRPADVPETALQVPAALPGPESKTQPA